MMMVFVVAPGVENKFSIEHELPWATNSCSVPDPPLHPELSLIARGRLTNFITQVFNNIESVLLPIFLNLFLC